MLAIKEVAQDICAATQMNKQVTKLMVVCINVTSKGFDGENVDPKTRQNLNEIIELCEWRVYVYSTDSAYCC